MADIDISKGILEKVRDEFEEAWAKASTARMIYGMLLDGKGDYELCSKLAKDCGQLLAKIFQKHIPDMKIDGVIYQNVAEKVLEPVLGDLAGIVNEAAFYCQEDLNARAGIKLKPVTAEPSKEVAEHLAYEVANSNGDSKITDAQIVNYALSTVDENMKANAEFLGKSGVSSRITRAMGNESCKFCASLVYDGEYKGPGMPDKIFIRHRGCDCLLIYKPVVGKYQAVWSKKKSNEYGSLVAEQREYLSRLDKMIKEERRAARNAAARERRLNR